MMTELPKAYEAKKIDEKWYQFWDAKRYFTANPLSTKPTYCIVIPPPNVTGVLHMGHALVNTVQDILIRWKRMLGFETLWVPGTDHAGIATQMVVERHLIKTEGKKRTDYTREEFLKHVWTWKEKSENRIIEQLKRLGNSCDWTRLRFTMDENNSLAVRTMFKKLFDDGLIYRGDYLVNWDPHTQTALADDEVEYEDKQSFLWYFKYPLRDESEFISIATTRPETMLGDTAVAVSPNDERFKHLIGKEIRLPLMNRLIPIIADHHVDPSFGTGVVKITPAHDPNDYQIGLSHRLPFINIMTPDGKINENGGHFQGLSMTEARQAVVSEMKEKGLLEKVEPHLNRVGISYRSKAIIEPYLSKQWFVKMDGFSKKLREVVQNGQVKLIPSHWESTYFHWIDNLRDWCISRQLWWGHRIPIWYHKEDSNRLICYAGSDLPDEVKNAPEEWIQDSDVLDTWFSSALWPFSTLGWPEQTPELAKFYPTSVLVTGHDILFFWVARMILMGDYALDQPPFPETYLLGLIYGKSYWRQESNGGILYVNEQERSDFDMGKPIPKEVFSKWEKMSKSKGNIIDPLEMIDQFGTDAVRMALCASATQARQIDLDRRRFEEFKNFTNKIWNGARFVLMNLDGNEQNRTMPLTSQIFSQGLDEALFTLEDQWILSVLNRTVESVNVHLNHYQFDQAAIEAYDFFWKEFCAYYVEIAKPILFGKIGTVQERTNKQKLLVIVLCQAIRLIHPMAPFITEELFHILKERLEGVEALTNADPYTKECIQALQSSACLVAPYPLRIGEKNQKVEALFALMEQIVYTIRNIRGEMKLSPGTATDVYIIGQADDPEWQSAREHITMISALVKTRQILVETEEPKIGFACTGVYHALKIQLPLPEELLKQEKTRLNKEQEKLEISLEKLKNQLSNTDFVSRAPVHLIEKQNQQLFQTEQELREIKEKLMTLP
ncbi:Valine--tRNA ligase [Candidatus Protochlamydia amoebophila]|uniref:Valine--tRNA ligase n=2 Tax=Candidatus Protochlamydia amoebophila TaxID=362787 RepID=A0A0C1JML5_9BACT|nr:Valine--tRNA ligase [Candidatus Protochlamydia amoebophila]